MKDNGTWLALGIIAALGAAGVVAQQKRRRSGGSRAIHHLPYRASGSGTFECSEPWEDEAELTYAWDDSKPPPTTDDLEREAKRYFGDEEHVGWMVEACKKSGDLSVEIDNVEPRYEMRKTLAGYFVDYEDSEDDE